MTNGKWFYIYASSYALKYHNIRLDWLIQIFHTEKRTNKKVPAGIFNAKISTMHPICMNLQTAAIFSIHCYFSTNLINHSIFQWVSPVIAVLHSEYITKDQEWHFSGGQHIEHCGGAQMKVSDGQTLSASTKGLLELHMFTLNRCPCGLDWGWKWVLYPVWMEKQCGLPEDSGF